MICSIDMLSLMNLEKFWAGLILYAWNDSIAVCYGYSLSMVIYQRRLIFIQKMILQLLHNFFGNDHKNLIMFIRGFPKTL